MHLAICGEHTGIHDKNVSVSIKEGIANHLDTDDVSMSANDGGLTMIGRCSVVVTFGSKNFFDASMATIELSGSHGTLILPRRRNI